MHHDFDHRCCPNCEDVMRLALVEPRHLVREDQFEDHTYRCDRCGNLSRFVFEMPSRAGIGSAAFSPRSSSDRVVADAGE